MSEPGKKKFFSNTQWSEKFLEVLLLFSLHGLNLFLPELKSKYHFPIKDLLTTNIWQGKGCKIVFLDIKI